MLLGCEFSRFLYHSYNSYHYSCEVIRDRKTGDSLQYAFVEFEDKNACEKAYFKMDNVLIDDRRIHVDFSQSVSNFKWKGKGRLEIVNAANKYDKNSTEEREVSGKLINIKNLK